MQKGIMEKLKVFKRGETFSTTDNPKTKVKKYSMYLTMRNK